MIDRNRDVGFLDIGNMARNALLGLGCKTIGDVIDRVEDGQLIKAPNVGRRSIKQIVSCLMAQGYSPPDGLGVAEPSTTYLIWSNEHRAWWRQNGCGYTVHVSEAGRYDRDEALSISANARDGWLPGAPPPEIPVALADVEFCEERYRVLAADDPVPAASKRRAKTRPAANKGGVQ